MSSIVTSYSIANIIMNDKLFQARMKSNEVLQEHLKQIIAISGATLALTVTFLGDVLEKTKGIAWTWLLSGSWILLGISVLLSVVCIAALVNNLDNEHPNRRLSFAAGARQSVQLPVMFSFIAFALGMICFAAFGAVNSATFLAQTDPSAKRPSLVTKKEAIELAKARLDNPTQDIRRTRARFVRNPIDFPQSIAIWQVSFSLPDESRTDESAVDAISGKILRHSSQEGLPEPNCERPAGSPAKPARARTST